MKKQVVLCILFSSIACIANGQSFRHSAGATISVLFGKITSQGTTSSFSMSQVNFCYFPRYNFTEGDNSSVSVGLPLGVGIGIVSNTYGGDAGVSFAYDIPLVLDYNFGCNATSESDENFGGYAGLGFGYYKVSITGSQYSDFKGASYGPILRAGIRFSMDHWEGKGITVGVFYKKGIEKDKLNTAGFNVLVDF